MHADGNGAPLVDSSQDYRVINGHQNGTHTLVTFERDWDTCDEKGDLQLGSDTARVMWAYHKDDPEGDGAGGSFHIFTNI